MVSLTLDTPSLCVSVVLDHTGVSADRLRKAVVRMIVGRLDFMCS